MITSVAPLIALVAVQAGLSPVETTVCNVIANPSAFDGKLVRFRAGVATDWTHGMFLMDRSCEGRIQLSFMNAVPVDEAKAFDKAVGTELNGGFDRTAVATFTGHISWKPKNDDDDFRYNAFKFKPQQINQIEVSRRWKR